MRKSLTFGVLPTLEEFSEAFVKVAKPAKTFHCTYAYSFTNDPRVGTCELTCGELWEALKNAHRQWNSDEPCKCPDEFEHDSECAIARAGDWCSLVLGTLGFEWI